MPDLDVAVVILTLNEADRIGPLLLALQTQRFGEIIVSDGGSMDGTVAIAEGIATVAVVAAPKGRGCQINAGVAATTCPLVLVLHADTRPPPTAPTIIAASLTRSDVALGCFSPRFDNNSRWLALYAWFARFETPLTTFGDQGFFFRRIDFHASGGAPDWPLLEDVDLRRRLGRQGRIVKVADEILVSARRFERSGYLFSQATNGLVLLGFWCGIPVPQLARFYGADHR